MAAIDAPTTILSGETEPIIDRDLTTYNEERDGGTGIGMAVCTGEVIRRLRESGGVVDATTPGLFMMPEGDKEYNTFLEMLRDQPMMPDPVFKEGEVSWTVEDAGFPLDQMDAYDIAFKKMYEDMFSRANELGTMGPGEFELRLSRLQNELSESKVENPNGGSTGFVSTGGPSVHVSERPPSSVHNLLQVLSPGTLLSPPEEGGYACSSEIDAGKRGSPVDA
jgi:hypothetical protein